MSEEALDRLAAVLGVEPDYLGLDGTRHQVSDEARRGVIGAMGFDAGDEEAVARSLRDVTVVDLGDMRAPAGASCFMPDWLENGRVWGVACQLYSVRSERNWGIGDFDDLGRFAEIMAAAGADFLGVNPLHALFTSDPARCSPFYPSTRQFLNPLYIAVAKVNGFDRIGDDFDPAAALRQTEHVDYPAVADLKLRTLQVLFRIFQAADDPDTDAAFERFTAEGGQSLYLHALFEALSHHMLQEGNGAGWHGWPDEYRRTDTDSVRAFAEEQAELVTFHVWLQWTADGQLGEAQARARAAGMRIGLYMDLAVGVAPDGSATWSDPRLTVPAARIGAPPDYFNSAGQDWGLAPLSPTSLAERGFEPYRAAIETVLRHAGALRIDHAMSLYRLFWIAEGQSAADGVYVRYPFPDMLRSLAEVSQRSQAIVIGEDLGVVPPGFRDVMRAMEIQSYRVFFFEKKDDWFIPPERYPREALACITTHDSHTLAGWWAGHDLDTRAEIGLVSRNDLQAAKEELGSERRRTLGLLESYGLLPPGLETLMRGETDAPEPMPEEFAVALHRLLARTPSRLLAVAAEDLVGSKEQVNIPGTTDEHPNWRRKMPVTLAELPGLPLCEAICAAIREERPRRT